MLDGKPLNQVEHFNYLGSYISWDGKCDKEINRRIAIAKNRFNNIRSLLTNTKRSIKTRMRFAKSYIWSILLYGCESWNISKQFEKKINATEMWIWRRILKVSWTERKTNEEVLQAMDTSRELMNTIRRRQLRFMGHTIREEKIEHRHPLLNERVPFPKKRSLTLFSLSKPIITWVNGGSVPGLTHYHTSSHWGRP